MSIPQFPCHCCHPSPSPTVNIPLQEQTNTTVTHSKDESRIVTLFLSVFSVLEPFFLPADFAKFSIICRAFSPYTLRVDQAWHRRLQEHLQQPMFFGPPDLARHVTPSLQADSYRLYKDAVSFENRLCLPNTLMIAVKERRRRFVDALIQERIDFRYIYKAPTTIPRQFTQILSQETALVAAVDQHFPHVVMRLLEKKVDPNVGNKYCYSLATFDEVGHQAIGSPSSTLLHKFCSSGEDPHMGFYSVSYPLNLAAVQGCLPVMQALLESKADVNCKDGFGMRPLLYAAKNGHAAAVSLLLSFKADPNAANICKQTAMFYANSQENIVSLLTQAGAAPYVPPVSWIGSIYRPLRERFTLGLPFFQSKPSPEK